MVDIDNKKKRDSMPRDNIVTYTKFTPGNAMKSCYVNRIFTHKYALGNFQMLFFARYIYLNVPFFRPLLSPFAHKHFARFRYCSPLKWISEVPFEFGHVRCVVENVTQPSICWQIQKDMFEFSNCGSKWSENVWRRNGEKESNKSEEHSM